MNVLFPLVTAGSGSDIFTMNLASGLTASKINTDIHYLPSWAGFLPSFASHLCDSSKFDIIHANTWNGFAFTKDTPLVATQHLMVHDPVYAPYKTQGQRLFHRLIRSYEHKTLNRADAVIAVSKSVCSTMRKEFGDYDVEIIHNGIDERKFYPFHVDKTEFIRNSDVTLILYTGNTSVRKGSDLLPKIMKQLGKRYVLITTAGLRTDSYSHLDNIISLGKLTPEELIRAYNACDIFLFPSRLEGLSLSMLEAMGCGKPIVTTNTSSMPELIKQDKGGILCAMDDVSEFAEAIRILEGDENERKKMGNFNRQRVLEEFTLEMMTKEYIKIYQRIH